MAADGHRVQDPAQRVAAVPGRGQDLNRLIPGLRGAGFRTAPGSDRDWRWNRDSGQVDPEGATAPQVGAGQPQRAGMVPTGDGAATAWFGFDAQPDVRRRDGELLDDRARDAGDPSRHRLFRILDCGRGDGHAGRRGDHRFRPLKAAGAGEARRRVRGDAEALREDDATAQALGRGARGHNDRELAEERARHSPPEGFRPPGVAGRGDARENGAGPRPAGLDPPLVLAWRQEDLGRAGEDGRAGRCRYAGDRQARAQHRFRPPAHDAASAFGAGVGVAEGEPRRFPQVQLDEPPATPGERERAGHHGSERYVRPQLGGHGADCPDGFGREHRAGQPAVGVEDEQPVSVAGSNPGQPSILWWHWAGLPRSGVHAQDPAAERIQPQAGGSASFPGHPTRLTLVRVRALAASPGSGRVREHGLIRGRPSAGHPQRSQRGEEGTAPFTGRTPAPAQSRGTVPGRPEGPSARGRRDPGERDDDAGGPPLGRPAGRQAP